MEINLALSKLPIESVYGFGSFFRGQPHNDIDIIAVTNQPIEGLTSLHRDCCLILGDISKRHKEVFDFTLFTTEEFQDAPLRDRQQLIKLL